ncbi:MAG: hypothetical protein RJA70_4691 [Pseudomonadota bacterium]|jgi:hypothetical protein
MTYSFDKLNWLAVLLSFVAGQGFLTLWFTALFGAPWAAAYGAPDAKAHTKELPGHTYAIGAACTLLVTLGIALLQAALGVQGVGDGLALGGILALCLCAATVLPGYAFLRRWSASWLAIGSQVLLILIVSVILAAWPA